VSDVFDLYQVVILDHNKAPRNYGRVEAPTHTVEAYNPLCGDRLTITLEVVGDRVQKIRFEGSSCAIARASASLMTEHLAGKSTQEAKRLSDALEAALSTGAELPADASDLTALAGVRRFPTRIRCATLAWRSVVDALGARGG
jgi:nitrogen fixation protein NifU and related proteins